MEVLNGPVAAWNANWLKHVLQEMMSKLSDGGAKIMKKIKEYTETMEPFKANAAVYEARLSSSSDVPKRSDSTSNRAQSQVIDLGTPSPTLSAASSGQQPAVRVRSNSDNNIYNSAHVGHVVRKPQGVNFSESGVENLEDSLTGLRV